MPPLISSHTNTEMHVHTCARVCVCLWVSIQNCVCPFSGYPPVALRSASLCTCFFLGFAFLHLRPLLSLSGLGFAISPGVAFLPLLSISPWTCVLMSPLPSLLLVGTSPSSPPCFLSSPSACLSRLLSLITAGSLLIPFCLLPAIPSLPSCSSVLASQNTSSLHLSLCACFPMALIPSRLPSLSLCDLGRGQIWLGMCS